MMQIFSYWYFLEDGRSGGWLSLSVFSSILSNENKNFLNKYRHDMTDDNWDEDFPLWKTAESTLTFLTVVKNERKSLATEIGPLFEPTKDGTIKYLT